MKMKTATGILVNYKPVVSWTLNDRLSKRGLSSQLASFKQCGFGGVLIMPWAGLPYEFMSEEWLDMVEWIVLSAKKDNLEVWIWDDWLFPSGFAGGLVGREDRYKSKTLKVSIDVVLEDGEEFESALPPRVIAAGVFPVDKHNNPSGDLNHLRVKPGGIIRYRATGRNRIIVVGWDFISGMRHTVRSHTRCLMRDKDCDIYTAEDEDAFSVDMLNCETAERYLKFIHEKYWRRIGKHFGKTFKGFFYDEPGIPSMFPWTYELAEEFKARKGYDITKYLVRMMVKRTYEGYDLPAMAWEYLKDEKLKTALADYNDIWTGMMADNFYGVIQRWCHRHGVLCTGHQGSDESLRNLLSGSGTYFKNMEYSDAPGTDTIWGQITLGKFIDYPRLAGSRASVLGKPWALSESFAVMGHGLYLDEMRYIAEHQIIRGVNKFTPSIANYNPEKSFYFHPPELSPAKNPIIKKYGALLNQRMEKLCSLMSSGEPLERVCLYVPLDNYYRNEPEITEKIDYLARKMTYSQKEYDYVWDNDLFSMKVRKGKLTSKGGQRYSGIIIPPGSHINTRVTDKLRVLKDSGCNLLVCSPAQKSLTKFARVIKDTDGMIKQFVRMERPMAVLSQDVPVSSLTRKLDQNRYLTLFLNESADHQSLEITSPNGWNLYEEDLNSQEIFKLRAEFDSAKVQLRFFPGESKLIIQDKTSRMHDAPYRPEAEQLKAVSLDSWKIKLPGKNITRITNPLPSWNELGYGTYSGVIRYLTEFNWNNDFACAILDLGSVHYAATVFLDGKKTGDCVFTPFTLGLTGLTPGKHLLEVEVLNTLANSVCGTKQRYCQLEKEGVFYGTYAPIYIPLDRKKLVSGLLGPANLFPVSQKSCR